MKAQEFIRQLEHINPLFHDFLVSFLLKDFAKLFFCNADSESAPSETDNLPNSTGI